jgi:hypothetical protein
MELEDSKSVEQVAEEEKSWSDCNNTEASTSKPLPSRSGNQTWLNPEYKRQRVSKRGRKRGRGGYRQSSYRPNFHRAQARAYQEGFQAGFNQALLQQQQGVFYQPPNFAPPKENGQQFYPPRQNVPSDVDV